MNETSIPTQSERNLAALAHASIVLGIVTNFVGGIVVALVIWVTYRERSTYVRFHALQALFYQAIAAALSVLAWIAWTGCYLVSLVPIIVQPDRYAAGPPPFFWVSLGSMILPCGFYLLLVVIGLWGALRAYTGSHFRYPLLGKWLERQNL